MTETTGPHRAPVEDLLPDVKELCALVKEGVRLFHEWAQVHRGEDLAARAEELCEDTLKQLEDSMNHNEDTVDNVYLQLAEVETLVQEAAEAHTHAWGQWGHPMEESQDVTKAANLLREEHQADVIHQARGHQLPTLRARKCAATTTAASSTNTTSTRAVSGRPREGIPSTSSGRPQQLEYPILGASSGCCSRRQPHGLLAEHG